MKNRIVLALAGALLATGLASAQPADAVVEAPTPEAPAVGAPADPPSHLWGETDFLIWWLKGAHTPPLVSSGPAGSGAILGRGGVTLFGGSGDEDPQFGGLFRLGYWLDDDQTVGVEGDYFFLAPHSDPFTAGGNGAPGTPVIARPFFNVNSGAPDSELVASPGLLRGTVTVDPTSRLQGAELDAVDSPCWARSCGFQLQFLGGFRWLQLKDGLGINENLQVLPGVPVIGGDTFAVTDQFGTRNDFYGGQIGARAEWARGPWFLDLTGKIGLGDTHETVDINGATTITPPGGPATIARGGLLALPSNMGHHSRDAFSVVPELGVTVGYQPTERVRIFAGYTFLYWSDVVRPGDQIDVGVNPARLPTSQPVGTFGPSRPRFAFNETDFWAQGVQFGVEFRY